MISFDQFSTKLPDGSTHFFPLKSDFDSYVILFRRDPEEAHKSIGYSGCSRKQFYDAKQPNPHTDSKELGEAENVIKPRPATIPLPDVQTAVGGRPRVYQGDAKERNRQAAARARSKRRTELLARIEEAKKLLLETGAV